jgi:hypothetical protein
MLATFLRAGLVTAVIDGLFSSVLAAFFYGSTVKRLWQGVASVLLGATALDGGTRTAIVGVLMHMGVAFSWSAVFLLLFLSSSWIRGVIETLPGALAAAAVYGPIVWIAMSLAIVPLFTHRQPIINLRWWIQFAGHVVFVALPIVAIVRSSRLQ